MGVLSRLAGGSSSIVKGIGLVVAILTIIPGIFKACSTTVHDGEVAYLIWRGQKITRGHFMYPLRDFMRRLLHMEPLTRSVFPPKPRYTGRCWYVPILSRYQVENTANREHVTVIEFTRYDETQQCDIVHSVEAQLVWGQKREPIPNPFYVRPDLGPEDMQVELRRIEGLVGPLKGDICRQIHEPYIYPWGALFNGVHYEALALGLLKRAVFEVLSDPAFPKELIRDSNAVFQHADARCSNRLLLLYASDFRELNLSDAKHDPMQTLPIASALRNLTDNDAVQQLLQGLVQRMNPAS